MSYVYDPRTVTVTVGGVSVPVVDAKIGAVFGRGARSATVPSTKGRYAASGRVEFTIEVADAAPLWDMIRRALPVPGDRGCFHDGCVEADDAGEGGTHWCRMGGGR